MAAVVAALQSPQVQSSNEVLERGLHAIVNLAAGSPANQAQLGELGVCAGESMLGVDDHIGHRGDTVNQSEFGACVGDLHSGPSPPTSHHHLLGVLIESSFSSLLVGL